jgi:hypothetical protein
MAVPASSVEWAWQQQGVWSQTADRLRAGPARARRWALVLTIVASATAVLSSQVDAVDHRLRVGLAVLTALLGATVAVLRATQSQDAVRRWTRARAAAEALKTVVFEYLAGADGAEGAERDQRLEAAVRSLQTQVGDLERSAVGARPRARALPDVHDVPSYLDRRVRQQVEQYYEPRAREYARRLRVVRAVEIGLALVAAGLGSLAATAPAIGAWASVATTAGAAVTAHAAAERYAFLEVEYSRTASQLRYLLTRPVCEDGAALTGLPLVRECERIMALQNQGWKAKWAHAHAANTGGTDPTP